jgi:hypothetical protein
MLSREIGSMGPPGDSPALHPSSSLQRGAVSFQSHELRQTTVTRPLILDRRGLPPRIALIFHFTEFGYSRPESPVNRIVR